MFDWIPLQYYSNIYYLFMMIMVIAVCLYTSTTAIGDSKNIQFLRSLRAPTLLFVIFYMGFRPISGQYFGDMSTYARIFNGYAAEMPIGTKKDLLFHSFTYLSAQIMSVQAYFFVCVLLYVLPLWFAVNKWFKNLSFYAFLLLIVSFSFWAYGTNGIRNGIATSLFLFAISREKWISRLLILFLAINFHKSMYLPSAMYMLVHLYNKPKLFLSFWILCIPLSLLGGSFFQTIFASLFEDDRVSYLTEGNINNDNFSSTGFRWDFLIYSASAVYAGYYYIFKKGFSNKFYNILYSTYLLTNAFWVLVIKANFSNRFAYLSWFMMALVIVFPLLKLNIMPYQNRVLAYIFLIYFSFTFYMNFIVA